MTLDEAIVHAREVAASLGDCSECAKDHIQLAEWLEELRELRDTDKTREITIQINNLKITGSAETIHELAHVYSTAACFYGREIVDEINGKHSDAFITELEAKQKTLETTERQLINAIKDSDYYKKFSAEMSDIIDDILKENG